MKSSWPLSSKGQTLFDKFDASLSAFSSVFASPPMILTDQLQENPKGMSGLVRSGHSTGSGNPPVASVGQFFE
jgi:hypothetical protein